jgi:hypothetical protein
MIFVVVDEFELPLGYCKHFFVYTSKDTNKDNLLFLSFLVFAFQYTLVEQYTSF